MICVRPVMSIVLPTPNRTTTRHAKGMRTIGCPVPVFALTPPCPSAYILVQVRTSMRFSLSLHPALCKPHVGTEALSTLVRSARSGGLEMVSALASELRILICRVGAGM
jgi:hypothetical protein